MITEENEDLKNIVESNTELKDMIVEFVGRERKPENDEVRIEDIVEVFTEQFPEFLLVLAEENWLNGYTQALSDVDFVSKNKRTPSDP